MDFDWDWFMEYGVWIIVAIVVATLIFLVLKLLAPRWIKSLISKITPEGEDWSRASRIISRIILWLGIVGIIGAIVLVVLPGVGVDISVVTDAMKDAGAIILAWLWGNGVHIVIILAVAFAAQQIAKGMIPRIVRGSVNIKEKRRQRIAEEVEQRAETLGHFLVGVAMAVIWVVAVFMVLSEFNIDIAPLIAGAGVIGIAVGFGTQGLIRDLLAGLFIILEDQYAKGDWVQVAGVDGEVEYLGLRRTILRDFDGTHHTIPNGEVKIASNFSKDWACVNMDVSVGYGEDLDRVAEIVDRISIAMASEEDWKKIIIEAPQVLRVQNFGDSGIDLKIWGKTTPMMQWAVTGELRRRIKRTFDEEGIEIPWPHIKLYFGDDAGHSLPSGPEAPKKPKRRRKKRKVFEVKGSGE